jgi:hypothetical protein
VFVLDVQQVDGRLHSGAGAVLGKGKRFTLIINELLEVFDGRVCEAHLQMQMGREVHVLDNGCIVGQGRDPFPHRTVKVWIIENLEANFLS